MLFAKKTVQDKRKDFRTRLSSGELLQLPGAFSPFVALMAEREGFDGVYVSGATVANDLALPDIGLTTLTEVAQRAKAIACATDLPVLADSDTGFGESMSVSRTVREMEAIGLAGIHLEDQVNPKRCGHLDNKQIVPVSDMVQKIRAASRAKSDSTFLLMARTDSRASEGLQASIERAKAYVDAGADAIFPEALTGEKEFEAFRKAVSVPLLANMTEFGKSKLLDVSALQSLGINIVIYPVTFFRLAMQAVEDGLKHVKAKGTQEALVEKMQTRKHLYEVLRYEEYSQLDKDVFNFKLD